jgi:hypothetical protein
MSPLLKDGRNLVFIVGCPRSGTTYLQKLLASHPSVHSGWESYVFAWYVGPLIRNWLERERLEESDEIRGKGLHAYLNDEEFRRLTKNFVSAMVGDLPDGALFLEKTPEHSLWIQEIVSLFPESRFINLTRDGRDVVASLLATSRTWGSGWASRYAFNAAKMWVRYTNAIQRDRHIVPSENFIDIKYEELRKEPFDSLAKLARFMKVDWSDSDIRRAVEKNDLRQAVLTGGTQLLPKNDELKGSGRIFKDPKGFIRKGEPGSWRTDLKFYEKWQVWLFARKTLSERGYSWRYPW